MRLSDLTAALAAQLLCLQVQSVLGGKGILRVVVNSDDVSDGDVEEAGSFCIRSYPKVFNLTHKWADAPKFNLSALLDVSASLEEVDTCEEDERLSELKGKVAVISDKANCSVLQRVELAKSYGASAVLLTKSAAAASAKSNQTATAPSVPVGAFLLTDSPDELAVLAAAHPQGKLGLWAPEEPDRQLDASILIIFAMAVFTVGAGSLWSGYTKHYLRLKKAGRRLTPTVDPSSRRRSGAGGDARNPETALPEDEDAAADDAAHPKTSEEELSVRVTPILVVFFVGCMCGMLVLLYYFFDKLVYVIMGMFVLASIIATYSCFEPFVMWTYRACPSCPTLQLPRCNLYLFSLNMELRQFALLLFSIALSIVWLVFRKEDWAWILQDILGILFSINMLKVLRLPSYKICTILLSILFIYDIFFVFITPHLTSDGKSVMVEVATGGGTGEQLPMVLKVPHMGYNPYSVCWVPYSMLGFGDILVPGLLLSYCHSFDLYRGTPCKVYWALSYLCYWLSLLVCFVGLFVMDNAQPALLYIVPGTLIPVAVLALARGELKDFWEGDGSVIPEDELEEEDDEEEDGDEAHGQVEEGAGADVEEEPKGHDGRGDSWNGLPPAPNKDLLE